MLKIIYRIENKDLIYYEAVFQWGSLFAFTISELTKQLTENYNVNLN